MVYTQEEIPRKSKTAVIVEYGKPLQLHEYPVPEVEPGGILVKVEMAGICGSDLHHWHGRLGAVVKKPLPNIPGHEVVGRIVKLGDGRKYDAVGESLSIGDRILWPHLDCGECFWCVIANQPTLCANRKYYAFRCSDEYPHLLGGYAEYEYVMPGTAVLKVAEEIRNEEVVGAGCAFRTVIHAFERLRGIGFQDTVVIQGAGPIGLYSVLLARESGAAKVIVIDASEQRLKLAQEWGADHVISLHDEAAKRRQRILDLTSGRGGDIVVEGSGNPLAFTEGLGLVRRGGQYLVIGQSTRDETTIVPSIITLGQLDVIGSMSGTIRDFYKAVQFIKNNRDRYRLGAMVTNKYRLEEVNEALVSMESGKEIKPVIIP